MIAAEIDLSNMNNQTSRNNASNPDDSTREILKQSPSNAFKRQRTKAPLTNAAKNPTNEDVIASTFIHVLSAFAIAED